MEFIYFLDIREIHLGSECEGKESFNLTRDNLSTPPEIKRLIDFNKSSKLDSHYFSFLITAFGSILCCFHNSLNCSAEAYGEIAVCGSQIEWFLGVKKITLSSERFGKITWILLLWPISSASQPNLIRKLFLFVVCLIALNHRFQSKFNYAINTRGTSQVFLFTKISLSFLLIIFISISRLIVRVLLP